MSSEGSLEREICLRQRQELRWTVFARQPLLGPVLCWTRVHRHQGLLAGLPPVSMPRILIPSAALSPALGTTDFGG